MELTLRRRGCRCSGVGEMEGFRGDEMGVWAKRVR